MVRCNKCDWKGEEEDLKFILEDENDLESGINACPNCKTDGYLSDVEILDDRFCECGHLKSDHTQEEGCLGCPCKKGRIETKTKEGYVAMNEGDFKDLQNMTFLNSLKDAKKWKGQKILKVEIKFYLGEKNE